MTEPHPAIAELTDDGDTFDLGDGRTLRLLIRPDEAHSVTDDEFFGAFEWPERGTNDYGHHPRPDGFDGNAELLSGYNVGPIWWQPPKDGPKRGHEHFAELRHTVLELLEFGYVGVIVELLQGVDAYHRPIVVNAASLWGIEWNVEADFLADVVGDLVAEVLA